LIEIVQRIYYNVKKLERRGGNEIGKK